MHRMRQCQPRSACAGARHCVLQIQVLDMAFASGGRTRTTTCKYHLCNEQRRQHASRGHVPCKFIAQRTVAIHTSALHKKNVFCLFCFLRCEIPWPSTTTTSLKSSASTRMTWIQDEEFGEQSQHQWASHLHFSQLCHIGTRVTMAGPTRHADDPHAHGGGHTVQV
eukprot:555856-Rhodomonas_salina.2